MSVQFDDQILLELKALNRKQQLANEIAYQQLISTNESLMPMQRVPSTIMADFNERLDI